MAALSVLNQKISYIKIDDEDYISITDMLKSKDGDFFVSDWLRNRNTIEFLGIWEEIHNPNFNYGEFAIIKSQAGLNSYKISVKEWTEKTNAIGIISKAGRYGGTYAHKDIAFEFGMWISPKFKLLLIKEFERLKAEEQKARKINFAAMRAMDACKKRGQMILVFPSGTRYRPGKPETKRGLREIDSYLRLFDYMLLVGINGNCLRINPDNPYDMLEDILEPGKVTLTAHPVLDCKKFREDVLSSLPADESDPKQKTVDQVMQILDEIHNQVESKN